MHKTRHGQAVSRNVCMYVCMHACMHACRYVFMYVCMYVCACTCAYDDLFDANQTCINQSTNIELQFDQWLQDKSCHGQWIFRAKLCWRHPFCPVLLSTPPDVWKRNLAASRDAVTTMLQVSVQNPAYYTGTPAYYTGLTLYLSRRPLGKCSKLVRSVH